MVDGGAGPCYAFVHVYFWIVGYYGLRAGEMAAEDGAAIRMDVDFDFIRRNWFLV